MKRISMICTAIACALLMPLVWRHLLVTVLTLQDYTKRKRGILPLLALLFRSSETCITLQTELDTHAVGIYCTRKSVLGG